MFEVGFMTSFANDWTRNMAQTGLETDEYYSVFHKFRQAKFAYIGSILSSSQF